MTNFPTKISEIYINITTNHRLISLFPTHLSLLWHFPLLSFPSATHSISLAREGFIDIIIYRNQLGIIIIIIIIDRETNRETYKTFTADIQFNTFAVC